MIPDNPDNYEPIIAQHVREMCYMAEYLGKNCLLLRDRGTGEVDVVEETRPVYCHSREIAEQDNWEDYQLLSFDDILCEEKCDADELTNAHYEKWAEFARFKESGYVGDVSLLPSYIIPSG